MELGTGILRVLERLVLSWVVLALGTILLTAQSTTNANWTDSTGNWTTASNWSCNCIPNNNSTDVFNVTIPAGGISLDSTSSLPIVTINMLSLSTSLGIHNGASLNITGDLLNYGVFDVDSTIFGTFLPVVSVSGNVRNNNGGIELGFAPGGFSEELTTMAVAGIFSDSKTSDLILNPFSTLQASAFNNAGFVLGFGGAVTTSGSLMNETAGSITLQPSGRPTANGAALNVGRNLTNEGSLLVGGSTEGLLSTFTVGGNLANTASGGLTLDNVSGTVAGQVGNVGGFILYDGTSLTTGKFTNTGNVSLSYPNTFIGNASSLIVSSFANKGNVSIYGNPGLPEFSASLTVNGGGSYTQTAGLTDVNGTLAAPSVRIDGGTLSISGGPGFPEVSASLTVNGGGSYTQTAGLTDVNGTLMAPSVRIDGGTLSGSGMVTGNVFNKAIVSPGGPTLTINGNYAQEAGGTLVIDIASATGFSMLDVTGKASLDGTADFDFLNGYVPAANTDFGFLKAGSVAGDFTSLEFTGIKYIQSEHAQPGYWQQPSY